MNRTTIVTLRDKKKAGEKIAMLTAYDYPTAKILDESGVDIVLVGDSCGNVVMGRADTLSVTMDEMVHHTRMAALAVNSAMVVADMPFLSYQISPQEALRNAGRLIAEAGAQAVKLEGPVDKFGDSISAILRAGIPVMGHLGLTPQSVNAFGGYKVQGRTVDARVRLKQEARDLEEAGCFAIVLECIPADLATEITEAASIPIIGIGAGARCDGQVLVLHDILGWGTTTFCKTFGDAKSVIAQACSNYVSEVKSGVFPAKEHEFE